MRLGLQVFKSGNPKGMEIIIERSETEAARNGERRQPRVRPQVRGGLALFDVLTEEGIQAGIRVNPKTPWIGLQGVPCGECQRRLHWMATHYLGIGQHPQRSQLGQYAQTHRTIRLPSPPVPRDTMERMIAKKDWEQDINVCNRGHRAWDFAMSSLTTRSSNSAFESAGTGVLRFIRIGGLTILS